jgi:L-threonylcarbamoyladenylate synthase
VKRIVVDGEPSEEMLDDVAATLAGGGVVLLPTDTIYGLHAMVGNEAAVARIAAMKEREASKRFVVIAASVGQLASAGAVVPDLLRDIWPAPLTAIVPSAAGTLAVRVPALPWLLRLLQRTGPLVSTSANRSGEPPIVRPDLLARDLQQRIDSALDAGPRDGNPSAIVDFTENSPRLIREGDPTFTQFLRKTLRITL